MKPLLLLTLLSLSLCSMEIQKQNLFIPASMGKLRVFKMDEGFVVEKNGNFVNVEPYRLDSSLRTMNTKQLAKFLNAGYLSINKSSDNSYSIQSHARIKGGGIFGAWLGSTVGYFAVTFAGNGAIHLAALCTGPFYIPVSGTLHKMCAIPIHNAACLAAISLGVTTAVATGPV